MLLPSEIGDQSQQVTKNNLMGAAHGNTTFNKRARDELFDKSDEMFEQLFHYTTVPRTIRWEPPLGELHLFFWKYRSGMWVEWKGETISTIGSSPKSFWQQKSLASFITQLDTRQLGPKEADYAADIRKLTTFGYPTADVAIIETISTRHFLRGLGDHNITLTMGMHEPKFLQEAQEIAECCFHLREEINHQSQQVISRSELCRHRLCLPTSWRRDWMGDWEQFLLKIQRDSKKPQIISLTDCICTVTQWTSKHPTISLTSHQVNSINNFQNVKEALSNLIL